MFPSQNPLPQALGAPPLTACSCLAAVQVPRVPLSHDPCVGSRAWQPREQIGGAGPAWARPSVPTGNEASPWPEPAPPLRYLRVFHGTAPAALPRVLRWERALFWSRSVAASRGETG